MDISALRAQTPGCAGRIHLNNAGAALMSQPTLDTMTAYLRREAEIGGYEAAAEARHAAAVTYETIAELVGLGAAVRQALDLGLEAIGQRAATLGARLRGQLAGLPGVTVHDLGQIRCAIVTAKIGGLAAPQAAQALARAGVNVSTTVPEHNPLDTQDRAVHPLIRFSPHYYNTDDEIDRTAELVAGLARLPARGAMSPACTVRLHRER
jgi:selenocysteine lyase/cysteine desulfurase